MYCNFYSLEEKPFAQLMEPRFFYLSDAHKAALDTLDQAVKNRQTYCLITGEIGTGKTSLLRYLMYSQMDIDYTIGYIAKADLNAEELPGNILTAFSQTATATDSAKEQSHALNEFLSTQQSKGKHPVLILDEAQSLSVNALNTLYVLASEFAGRNQPITIILAGEPALRKTLNDPKLDELSHSIDSSCELHALNEKEIYKYLKYRIKVAGVNSKLFNDEAVTSVFKHTAGVPRSINLLCDSALVYGYINENNIITDIIVNNVVEDRDHGRLFSVLSKAEEVASARQKSKGQESAHKKQVSEENTTEPSFTSNVNIAQTQTENKPENQNKIKLLISAAAAAIIAIVGVMLFSSEDKAPLPKTAKASKHIESPAVEVKKDIARLTVLENKQQARIAAIKKKLAENRRQQKLAIAIRVAEEEKERLKAELESVRKSEEQSREAARKSEERSRAVALKIKQEGEKKTKQLVLARKAAELENRRLKAELESALKAKEKINKRKMVAKNSLISRSKALENRQKEAARKKRIKEIQQAEESIEDAFE